MRWLPVIVLLAGALAGCGDDATPARPAETASLAPADDLGTPLPSAWPAVTLPEGSTVLDTNDDPDRLVVEFETQDLAAPVLAFLDEQLVAAGFGRGDTDSQGDTTRVAYTKGSQTATVTLEETTAITTVSVRIDRDTFDPSASPSSGS